MRYPDGAYIDIEYHLLMLALMSEVTPRANKKYCTVTPPPACLPPSAVVSVVEKEVVVVEEKKGKGWMVSPASWLLKGERKKNKQIQLVLGENMFRIEEAPFYHNCSGQEPS